MVAKYSKHEIQKALSNAGAISMNDQDVLNKCVALSSTVDVSPTQLADCWTVHSMNRSVSTLDLHAFEAFRMDVVRQYRDNIDVANTGAVMTRLAGNDGDSGIKRQQQQGPKPTLPNVTPPAKKHINASRVHADKGTLSIGTTHGRRVSMSPSRIHRSQTDGGEQLPKIDNKYLNRTDKGTTIASFNPGKWSTSVIKNDGHDPKCEISTIEFPTNVKDSYRHMFTTLDERAKVLEKHLQEIGDCMTERYNLGKFDSESEDELTNSNVDVAGIEEVGIPRQEKICCIGRICNSAHEGRINNTSVELEGSRQGSNGRRVELDLSNLQTSSYSLFPGQIVAVEGFNTSGRKLVADRICEGAAYLPSTSTVQELMKYHHDGKYQNGQPLKIMTSAGPFTTSDNIQYQPIQDLIKVVQTTMPDVVILIGPFVDLRHPMVASGNTTVDDEDGTKVTIPYEVIFANNISALFEDFYISRPNSTTQFIIVPSLDDATAEWVFPQPPFHGSRSGKDVSLSGGEGLEIGTLGLNRIQNGKKTNVSKYPRIHCVSNPCTIRINELVIGITSADVLFDLNSDSASPHLLDRKTNRLARIAQHLLQQRSYYPLFPGAAGSNLNLSRMKQWTIPCPLDLIILPSKLFPFAHSVLDSTVCINPGHLCKGTTGGSYADIVIHPINREVLENAGGEDVEIPHNIQERVHIEIKRI